MVAKDLIHDAVKHALMKDGERVIAAERNDEKIAVEIKSFLGHSAIQEFERALGQYLLS